MSGSDYGAERTGQRKRDHLRAVEDASVDLARDSFAHWRLLYNALPELALDAVSTRTEFAGKAIAAPLIISCMTGGPGEPFVTLNRRLAEAAERLGIPIGLGSAKVALMDRAALESFRIRDVARSVPVIANLGLVSFNYGITLEHARELIDVLQPDVLALHLNALQEAVQPGGDTNFRGLRGTLRSIIRESPVPVYVKECGGGIHPRLAAEIVEMGAAYVDVSGSDGTSWSAVEARLSTEPDFGMLFSDFGLPTAWILERIPPELKRRGRLVASGGIRNGIQAAKAIALGADFVAMARPFILAARDSTEAVEAVGERFIRELRTAMFLCGAADLSALDSNVIVT